jgi:RNA polymerase sigma-70 factor (ECF subfamily)
LSDSGEEVGEEELALRSRSGDRAAFEMLVRRTGRWVFARLYLQTGDAHRAEDLTQETFFTAWQQIDQLIDPAAFRGWLCLIAQRKLLDGVKREKRKKRWGRAAGAEEVAEVVSLAASPMAQAEVKEERERALAMLRGMPAEYRVPLALRYLAGADYETITKQLAMSNGSVRGLLQRGLAMLRERMGTGVVGKGRQTTEHTETQRAKRGKSE